MSPLSVFHLVALASLLLVAFSSASLLIRCYGRMSRREIAGVALSNMAALFWLVSSYLLSNVWGCRADSAFCLLGTVYQLLRNASFLLLFDGIKHRPQT